MNGVLLSQFLRFADDEFGGDVAARMSGTNRYSPASEYDHRELHELAQRLGEATGIAPADLLRRFGKGLFHYFARMYPVFFAGADSAMGFLSRIDTYVHGELGKLYPAGQFPRFEVRQPSPHRLELTYRSPRHLEDLAEGLIAGCAEHFGESIEVRREDAASTADEPAVRFVLIGQPRTPRTEA